MSGELINMDGIGTALVYIADKLGVTVQHIYTVYVAAQQTIAVINVLFAILFMVGAVIITKILYTAYKAHKTSIYDSFELVMIFSGIGAYTALLVLLLVIRSAVVAYFCPEYMAIQSLIETFARFV